MDISIAPGPLQGKVNVPSSKSMGHRCLICAALAEGESRIENVSLSQDMEATCSVLTALGADIQKEVSSETGRAAFTVRGGLHRSEKCQADCGESGSTLRFLMPVGLLKERTVTWTGKGRLPNRPMGPYYKLWKEKGIDCVLEGKDQLPVCLAGRLQPGIYTLPGDVSSQFVSGLLLALPLLSGDSEIRLTSAPESEDYIRMTLSCMASFGVMAERKEGGRSYAIKGGQTYHPRRMAVEGDDSQAAFWLAAGLLGGPVTCSGMNDRSIQADRAMTEIAARMGGRLERKDGAVTAFPSRLHGVVVDASGCPDSVPILAVLGALAEGTTDIVHAGRLRLKECDRLHAMAVMLGQLGADIEEREDGLLIRGKPSLAGGHTKSCGDHRVAMAIACAASRCGGPVYIEGAEAVGKSYPDFWKDFAALGGRIEKGAGQV